MLLEDKPTEVLYVIIILGGVGFVNGLWRILLQFGVGFSELQIINSHAFENFDT